QRHGLGEQHTHRVADLERLLVRPALRRHLLERGRGELDGRVQRESCELLALGLLDGLGLLLRELTKPAQEILGIAAERETLAAFHGATLATCDQSSGAL